MDFTKIATERVKQLHNVNDNEVNTINNNDNDIVVKPSVKTEVQVNAIAEKLVNELNNPEAWEFYCKVAWRLSEATIYQNLEIAKGGRNPQRYFSWLCNRGLKSIS